MLDAIRKASQLAGTFIQSDRGVDLILIPDTRRLLKLNPAVSTTLQVKLMQCLAKSNRARVRQDTVDGNPVSRNDELGFMSGPGILQPTAHLDGNAARLSSRTQFNSLATQSNSPCDIANRIGEFLVIECPIGEL